MAKQMAKSDVFAKIGAKANKAFSSAKKKDVKLPSGGNVPGGIENGVAKLTSIDFAEFQKGDNKGKPYFMAQAVVVNPDGSNRPWIVNGVKIDGLQTKFGPEALCDTPKAGGKRKTFEEHMDHVVNLFKMLAGKEAVESLENASELKELGESLIEQGTYFSFRTWQPPKRKKGEPGFNPKYDGPDSPPSRVIETWGAAIEDFHTDAGEGEEVEDEEEVDSEEETESEDEDTEEEAGEEESEDEDGEEESDEESDEETEDDGLDEVAEAADNPKVSTAQKAARKDLTAKAVEAGYTKEEVAEADDWASVVEMIRNPKEEEESEDEEASDEEGDDSEETEEEATPEVGNEYKYKPKGAKKAIDVEVTKINEAKGLAYVKDSATKKAVLDLKTKKPLGIPFAELSE